MVSIVADLLTPMVRNTTHVKLVARLDILNHPEKCFFFFGKIDALVKIWA